MIILITGSTHTGKTLLAQKLLEKLSFPYLSLDHLKMGLIRSGMLSLSVDDDDALTAALWPIAAEIAKTAIENGQNLIIEGCYIPPDWRESFGEDYLPHIRFIALAFSDAYIHTRYGDITAHANDIEMRQDDGYATPALLLRDNRRIRDNFGAGVTLIEGDYPQTIHALLLSFEE